MANKGSSTKKQTLIMFLADKLFHPQILFENESIQNQILNEPLIIICNHSRKTKQNRLTSGDGPIIRYVFNNHNICSLMAEDLMKRPLMKWAISECDCIPVRRNVASTEWLHKCKEKLDEGVSVVIFPEGTTIKKQDIIEFKPGFALLASLANVKILPVAINGTYKPFSKGKLKIKIGIPEELNIKQSTPTELKNKASYFQNKIENMYYSLKEDNNSSFFQNCENANKQII